MRIKKKLPLKSHNLSKSLYIIVIILPFSLLVCCVAAQNSEAAVADGIKVMSINLLFSEIDDRNKRLKIIADYVAKNDADFVLLQEVVRGELVKTDNSAKDLKEFIFKKHNLKYYVRTETETIPIPFASDFLRVGNGILSRNKIEYSDAKELPKTSESEVFDDYKLDFRRNVMMLRTTVNGYGPIHVYNTHLCARCKIKEREEQLDFLLKYVKKEEENITGENPVILGGDFNIDRIKKDGVEKYLYEKVLWEGFIDAYAAAAIDPLDELCEDKDNPDEHCTIGVTDLGDSNPGRIDYIFAKDFRKVTNSQVIFNSAITDDPAVSDHSAVSVSLVGNKLNPIAEIIGTWISGIWYRDETESKWIQMTRSTPDGDIAAGDFTGDGIADVASIWTNGLWYQDGSTLAWTKIPGGAPDRLTAGDVNGDGRSEIIGTRSNGIWYWDETESQWIQMYPSTPTGDIAAGEFTGDGKADVASCWDNGLWYQDGATLGWIKVSDSAPDSMSAGDVTGDGRSEIIGTFSSGIWYWDVAESEWTKMVASTPTGDIAAGDFTGDGKADVASIWDNGLWYQDGFTLAWTKVPGGAPDRLTAGDVTGPLRVPLNLFNIGNSIGEGISADGTIGSVHHETVWSTGFDPTDIVHTLNERFEETDPTGYYENDATRDIIFNHAVGGDKMEDFKTQAIAMEADAAETPSRSVGMVTVFLGNNDVCTDKVGTMTDLGLFEDQYRAGLTFLAESAVTKNAVIHVSGIPDIYWLWIAKRDSFWCREFAWPLVPCQELLANPSNDCGSGNSDLDPDTIYPDDGPNCIRRKDFHAAIRDDYNRILRDVLMEYKEGGLLPNAYYVDIFDIQFGSKDVNDGDCFHPSVEGHERLAEEHWCQSPWGMYDPNCMP